jgi:hypothetical protein
MENSGPKKLAGAVREAEEATAAMKDPELRKIAFSKILDHLLGGPKEVHGAPKIRRASRKREKPLRSGPSPQEGPMTWLEDLIREGFFDVPKLSGDILGKLAEQGHHLQLSNITWQLQQLVRQRKLRRQKKQESASKKATWVYSRW